MSTNQKMIGIDSKTKELIEKYYIERGFTTRSKYIKHLVQTDLINIIEKEKNPYIN